MTMRLVECEADRLYRELLDRRHNGYVQGFRSARLDLRVGGEEELRKVIQEWRPISRHGVLTDEYDIGFGEGMKADLELFLMDE
jgi:hypothetical protein